jgi:hypothetical protein
MEEQTVRAGESMETAALTVKPVVIAATMEVLEAVVALMAVRAVTREAVETGTGTVVDMAAVEVVKQEAATEKTTVAKMVQHRAMVT